MRLKGVFTAEAAYIFSFITLFVLYVIRFNFELHDRVLSDSCKIQGDLRSYQEEAFYYYSDRADINIAGIVCSPVMKSGNTADMDAILKRVEAYYDEYRLSSGSSPDWNNIDTVITTNKNAELIRKGGRAVQLIGDLINEG